MSTAPAPADFRSRHGLDRPENAGLEAKADQIVAVAGLGDFARHGVAVGAGRGVATANLANLQALVIALDKGVHLAQMFLPIWGVAVPDWVDKLAATLDQIVGEMQGGPDAGPTPVPAPMPHVAPVKPASAPKAV